MNRVFAAVMSISFFGSFLGLTAHAQQALFRAGVCKHDNKVYTLFSPPSDSQPARLKVGVDYMVFLKDAAASAEVLPLTLQGRFDQGSGKEKAFLQFLPYWQQADVPSSACKNSPALTSRFSPVSLVSFLPFSQDEVLRDFYVKSYFIVGEPRPIDNIESMVKNGTAIPVRVRILCHSEELTEDISMCHQITMMDDIIPL